MFTVSRRYCSYPVSEGAYLKYWLIGNEIVQQKLFLRMKRITKNMQILHYYYIQRLSKQPTNNWHQREISKHSSINKTFEDILNIFKKCKSKKNAAIASCYIYSALIN